MVNQKLKLALSNQSDDIALNMGILSKWFIITLCNDRVCDNNSKTVNDYAIYLHGLCVKNGIVCWDIVQLMLEYYTQKISHNIIRYLFKELAIWNPKKKTKYIYRKGL